MSRFDARLDQTADQPTETDSRFTDTLVVSALGLSVFLVALGGLAA
ncbi:MULTISPECIES: hypothetical protein [unclassified Afifella]|nr:MULTISPECIES: hypothetical protein [unclassified Afifella]MCF1504110.1 hypothetical protein [Afifella sp. H1R]MCT8268100.1 hypothetical protein [Afifella sp. JA880]